MAKVESKGVRISKPNRQEAVFHIKGDSLLVMHKFSHKAKLIMQEQQEAGEGAKKAKREPKDFQKCCDDATYFSKQGWIGIPASAFRAAMIAACRLVNYKMTLAKLSLFVVADGEDKQDGTPLIKITKGTPEMRIDPVTVGINGTDLRARPAWRAGWEARVRIWWDGDQFSLESVSNLLMRVGMQVGLLEGRPNSSSSDSPGMGWGTFKLIGGELVGGGK